jgi:hypothetical protein
LDELLPNTRNALSAKADMHALFMQQPGVDIARVIALLNSYLQWYLPDAGTSSSSTNPSSSSSSRPSIHDEGIIKMDKTRVVGMIECVYNLYHLLAAYLDDVRFGRVDARAVWRPLIAEGTGGAHLASGMAALLRQMYD